ncbi:MAG: DUF1616 domain-containing protein [Promethearchaeota archaeon]
MKYMSIYRKIIQAIIHNWDLSFILTYSSFYLLLCSFSKDEYLKIFGVVILLTFPGYLISLIIFPKHNDISSLNRLILSFIFSIIFFGIFGFLLNKIEVKSVYFQRLILISINFLCLIIIIVVRKTLKNSYFPTQIKDIIQKGKIFIKRSPNSTKFLTVVTILLVLCSIFLFIIFLYLPSTNKGTTSFYIYDQNGQPISSIRISVNSSISINTEVFNNEIQKNKYFLEVWLTTFNNNVSEESSLLLTSAKILYNITFYLESSNRTRLNLYFSFSQIGNYTVFFILFKNHIKVLHDVSSENYTNFLENVYNNRLRSIIEQDSSINPLGIWLRVNVTAN